LITRPDLIPGLSHETRVLLVSMPFGSVRLPALGPSLLVAGLAEIHVPAQLAYLNIRFAERIGIQCFDEIGSTGFLGERIFSRSLTGLSGTLGAHWEGRFRSPEEPYHLGLTAEEARARFAELEGEATTFVEECASRIDWSQFTVVGFHTSFQQNVASLALARRIKERFPEVTVVFGGSNCEAEMGAAILEHFPFVDAAFSGEADETFPEFVREQLGGAPAPDLDHGVIRRDPSSGQVVRPGAWIAPVHDLDALPYPHFDDYFEQFGSVPDVLPIEVPFETARGCWWGEKQHCLFCGLNGSSMAFRRKSPARALAEIRLLHERYSERGFLLRAVDNILSMSYFQDLFPELARFEKKARFFYETKANLSRAHVEALADAGVITIQPGIESLSTEVLRLMKKGCTMLQNAHLLRLCAERGIMVCWNLLYGFPGEPREAYEAMEQVILSLFHLPPPDAGGAIRVDRFSPYHQRPAELGMVNVRPHEMYRELYALEAEELTGLAYYFQYDYADGRDLRYCEGVQKRVDDWRTPGKRSALVGFLEKDQLLVWDTRSVAVSSWTRLRGHYRDIVLHCDAIRSSASIRGHVKDRYGLTEEEIGCGLVELTRRGFLLEEENQFVSLIVVGKGSTPEPPRGLVDELQADPVLVNNSV